MKKGHPFMYRFTASSTDQLFIGRGEKITIDGKVEIVHSINSVSKSGDFIRIVGCLAKGEDERE